MPGLKSHPTPIRRRVRVNALVLSTLLLSVVSLFVEQGRWQNRLTVIFTNVLDFTVLGLFMVEIILEAVRAHDRKAFVREHLFDLLFLLGFSTLFGYSKYLFFSEASYLYGNLPGKLIIVRNIFVLLKVFGRIRKLAVFVRSLTAHPARTVMLSFVLVIVTGTVVLMLPFNTPDRSTLGFLDSLFTATSAVCVTGLIVADTATAFSTVGQIVILLLIQIGGLGIMILSFFMAFILRRSLSIEDKFLISYMTSEKDMRNLGRSITAILFVTFAIEAGGAILLFLGFGPSMGFTLRSAFAAVFHAVSGFCNAGFSLFSDSLEAFKSNTLVNFVISALIIAGGLSFVVILDLRGRIGEGFRQLLARLRGRPRTPIRNMSLNTRVVLAGTVILLTLGMFLIYAFEHRHGLAGYDLKTQYLSAFFQSVTTRTAGFNTIPFGGLRNPTYLLMMIFMFIGAASGSTAGGVKINSIALFLGYVRSLLRDRREVTLFNHSVAKDLVLRALLILLFGLLSVLAGILILSLTESATFIQICFETVSAFGTVGLSAGITSELSNVGKCVIIVLMFIGRVGPLTLLAAAAQRARRVQVQYPVGEVLIG